MLRKFFYISAFLAVLLWIAPLFIDFSNYAIPYIADAQKTVGRIIKTGAIRLQLLPTPRIKIYDVSFGSAPGTSKPEMVKAKSVEVILNLFDLLRGKIVVKSVDLNTPEIILEKSKNGYANWDLNIASSENEMKKKVSEPTNAVTAGIIIKRFNISNATIHYINQQAGTTKTFSNLNIECDSEKLMGPYKINIRSDSTEGGFEIAIHTGNLNFNDKTALNADISLNNLNQKIHVNLMGDIDISKKQFVGRFKSSSTDYPLTLELPYQKIDLRKPINVQGDIQATEEYIAVKNLNLNHSVGQISGLLNYSISNQLFEADLKFKHQEDSINIHCSTQNFNDFVCHISSVHYQAILKWFTKDQLLKNMVDIKGKLKIEDDLLTFKKAIIQLGDAYGEANIQLDIKTKQTNVSAQIENVQKWGHLFGHDLPFSGAATIALKLIPTKDNFDISTKISLNKSNIFFDGSLGNHELLAKGSLSLEHIKLHDYIINLKSDILVKKAEIDLSMKNIEVKAKSCLDLFAGGKILIDLSKEKPHIAGSITAQPIQLTSYQNHSVQLERALYKHEAAGYQFLNIAANAISHWSSVPIKLPLHAFTMSLQINVPKIILGGLTFEALQSDISLKAGKLNVPFSAHLYGGKLNGSVMIESANDQNINLFIKFDDVALEKIQAVATHFSHGNASGEMKLTTHGSSQYDWVSRLKGHANFVVKDGTIKGFNLSEIVSLLKKPSNLLDLKHLQNCFSGKGETAFSNASGKFTVDNGVANTNDLKIDARDAQLKAEGQADILNWNMNFMGEVLAATIKGLPHLKFIIKGPLDQPSYNLDFNQIQQLFLQKGAGDLVSKALEKSIPGISQLMPGMNKKSKKAVSQASNSNVPEEEKQMKPEKVVKGLLKDIFG